MTLLTVVLSAYIRLAEVGVGCEDWPRCYAQLNVAIEKKGIAVLTQEGRDMAHFGARVAHRYIASILGLFIVVIFATAMRRGRTCTSGLLVPMTVFAITLFLAVLGYYTPTRSNPLITMGNLLGGMSLLGLLWWMMQREVGTPEQTPLGPVLKHRPLAVLAVALVSTQIVLGGWSSANYASGNCQEFFQCTGSEWAVAGVGNAFNPFREIELNSAGQVVQPDSLGALSMTHRLFALITAAYLAWLVRKLKPEIQLRSTLLSLSICSIGQILVGVLMIWLQLPLLMVTLHNALAAGLLLSSINLLHRLFPPTVSQPPD